MIKKTDLIFTLTILIIIIFFSGCVNEKNDENSFKQQRSEFVNQGAILVNGVFFENGTVITDNPWYNLTDIQPDLSPGTTGAYYIVLLDDQHQILNRFGFDISFYYMDYGMDGITGHHTDAMPFRFAIPYIPGTRFIEIQKSDGSVLINKTISFHTPTVEIISPNGGETREIGENITITWEAFDEDNDSLTYEVDYSKDNGTTWILLQDDFTEKQFIWNTNNLSIGNQYKVRIQATDWINTATDESNGTFSIISDSKLPK